MEILEKQILEMKNVLSFKGEYYQNEMMLVVQEIEQFIAKNNLRKTGPMVSVTLGVNTIGMQPKMEIEVLFPLDREISMPAKYKFKPIFRLCNAVKIRHVGSPLTLYKSGDMLERYISENGYIPITAGYSVTIKCAETDKDIENMIMDIYVGVSDNIGNSDNIL